MVNDVKNIINAHKNAWTLNYLFPEKYKGAKIPDFQNLPSNTMTLETDRSVTLYEGKYVGFFSPLVETCAPYLNDYDIHASLPIGSPDHYIVYADNDGGALNAQNGILNSLNTWNYSEGPKIQKLSAYRRLRVVGACMEISVWDRTKNYSGMIETAMGFEVMGNGLKNDQIDINKLSQYPGYRVHKSDAKIILKYKYNNEKYTKYGPYEPFSVFPCHIIHASGISEGASIRIKTTIHIEGVLMPNLVHFATRDFIIQTPQADQQKMHRHNLGGNTSYTAEEAEQHHENATGDVPGDNPSNNIPNGTPSDTKTKQKKKKTVKTDPLNKRDEPGADIDAAYGTYDKIENIEEMSHWSRKFNDVSSMTPAFLYDLLTFEDKPDSIPIGYESYGQLNMDNDRIYRTMPIESDKKLSIEPDYSKKTIENVPEDTGISDKHNNNYLNEQIATPFINQDVDIKPSTKVYTNFGTLKNAFKKTFGWMSFGEKKNQGFDDGIMTNEPIGAA